MRVIIRHRDDDIYDAFASYPDSQKKLRELQKFRGCGKSSQSPSKSSKGSPEKGPRSGNGKGKAFFIVTKSPRCCVLQDGDSNSYCDMVLEGTAKKMGQNGGKTEFDNGRKQRSTLSSTDGHEWEVMLNIPPPYAPEAA